jgi:hypothetical protein
MDQLGRRLDAVRGRLKECKDGWAKNHWTTVEQNLTHKWKLTIMMHDVVIKQSGGMKPYEIKYDWWEGSEEPAGNGGIFWNYLTDKLTGGPDLTRAWEMARNEFIQKARQGLV